MYKGVGNSTPFLLRGVMLSKVKQHIGKIQKDLETLAYSTDLETVFREWCQCFALSIANSCSVKDDLWNKRENSYLSIIEKYKDNITLFSDIGSELIQAFDIDPFQDHLGEIYMEVFSGNKRLGQNFTPKAICMVMAQSIIGENIPEEEKTIADECCGGAMLLAACEHYYNKGVNYQKYLNITAGDLDLLCVNMCYIQLSLIGARATVYHRNALTRECYN